VAVAATLVYSGVVSLALLKLVGAVIPLRVRSQDESVGMDLTQHGEEAYVHAGDFTKPRSATGHAERIVAVEGMVSAARSPVGRRHHAVDQKHRPARQDRGVR
jgi:hypothetical protein